MSPASLLLFGLLLVMAVVGAWGISATGLRQTFLREDILAESSYSYGFYRSTSHLFGSGQLPVHVVLKGVDMADSTNLVRVNALRAAVTSSPYIDARKVSMAGIDDWYCNWDPNKGGQAETLDGRDQIGGYWQTYLSFLNNSDPGNNNCGVFCELSPECNATQSGQPGDINLLPSLPIDPTTPGIPDETKFREAFGGVCRTGAGDWNGWSFLKVFTQGCGPDGKSGLCGSYWLQDLVLKDDNGAGKGGVPVASQLRAFQKPLDPSDIQAELDAIDDIEAKINSVRFPEGGGEAFPQAYILLVFGQLKQIRVYAVGATGVGLVLCWVGLASLAGNVRWQAILLAMLTAGMVCVSAVGPTVFPHGLNISLTQASIVPMLGLPLLLLLTFSPTVALVESDAASEMDYAQRLRMSHVDNTQSQQATGWEAVLRGPAKAMACTVVALVPLLVAQSPVNTMFAQCFIVLLVSCGLGAACLKCTLADFLRSSVLLQ